MASRFSWCLLSAVLLLAPAALLPAAEPDAANAEGSLPGTKRLTWQGDLASLMVDDVDAFLLSEIQKSIARRERYWRRDFSSPEAYEKSVAPNRRRLAHMLGLRDKRVAFDALQLLATTSRPALVGRGKNYKVYAVRWPVVGGMHGEGLLLSPTGRAPTADVIALPDATQTPEMLAGLAPGIEPASQAARRLAESGCRVLVPMLIDRRLEKRNGRANLTSREFLYRPAFELGRHLIGYEIQKILAGVDWFEKERGDNKHGIGLIGWGEGGLLAFYAAALDTRIDAACVSGYFHSRQNIWNEPLDRNVFGLLHEFGDAEIAGLIAPRKLIVEASHGPELVLPSEGGAPAVLTSPQIDDVRAEFARAEKLIAPLDVKSLQLVVSGDGQGPFAATASLEAFLSAIHSEGALADTPSVVEKVGEGVDAQARQQRQQREIDRHNQEVLHESPYVRAAFMKKLDTSSLENFAASQKSYRDFFRNDVIGHFDIPLAPPNPRTRIAYEEEAWTGHDVVLDVFPGVFAYGVLLVPKNIPAGEKRPVVVCQHGLEGRPSDTITGNQRAYHDFAAELCKRGFITFAPQNLYIFKDRFRTLQRKGNAIKKTLFSVIVPQHQQIVNWLGSLPNVDASRIGFYGLSYGGKSAMRIPALVPGYCLSICSADFNEWVSKNASTRLPYSYVWTGEYEIFEFDLGSNFNYSEMAALIAPRPFMVERGHFDGVSSDECVAYEYAKVRNLYAAKLHLPDRTAIEFFNGPHTINGQGTFRFLHKHLNWPAPGEVK